jgi:hypothetical protein
MVENITRWDLKTLNKFLAEAGQEDIVLGEDDVLDDPLGLQS